MSRRRTISPDVIAAFFAGITAVLSSALSIWLVKRSAHKDCEERIKLFRSGLHEMEHDGS